MCQLLFPVQKIRLNKIVVTDVPYKLLSSILKTPQDNDKVRCVKKHWKFIGNPAKKIPPKKNPRKKNPNWKIQLENPIRNPTRNPNW